MEELNDNIEMLDLMIRPAFAVKDNLVYKVNAAAAGRFIAEGATISELLLTGKEEYRNFQDGCLYLSLQLGDVSQGASVTKVNGYDIFILDQEEEQAELQAMALAAQELRTPLSNVMAVANRMYPVAGKDNDPALQDHVARINRGLYQMLRIIGNMSDAYRYNQESVPQKDIRNICALVRDILQASEPLIGHAQISLTYSVPKEDIFCLVDSEKLERAIHNMLANAIKFASKGAEIHASLVQKGTLLYLSVEDNGSGIAQNVRSNVYARYMRQPGIEDSRYGIGLGMVLIRAAASAHGGTVLIESPENHGTRITMTMQIDQSSNGVRIPLYQIDYAGEQSHPLIEFSETLPLAAYQKHE